MKTLANFGYRNIPNIVSFVGVLPLCILLQEDAFIYLCPLILFNNVMDDLDGILAGKLNLSSKFGAALDNVCDAVAHIIIAMVIGTHFGGLVLAASLIASTAILIRVVQRVDPLYQPGTGTPTNELMRHLLLVVLLHESIGFNITPYLVAVFLLNAATMLVPFPMQHLVRAKTKTVTAIAGVNIALALAWYAPPTRPIIAATFLGTYAYSLATGAKKWLQTTRRPAS